jgi:hypothetical protein
LMKPNEGASTAPPQLATQPHALNVISPLINNLVGGALTGRNQLTNSSMTVDRKFVSASGGPFPSAKGNSSIVNNWRVMEVDDVSELRTYAVCYDRTIEERAREDQVQAEEGFRANDGI